MDESSVEEMITLKQKFGYISDEESLKLANAIDNELLPFFNKEVVQDKETNVIAVERKGLNLFHPYLHSIKGMRNIISIKPLNHHGPYSMEYRFLSFCNFDRSNILLTDAITTGAETRKILTVSPFKFKALGGFKKVCGYMALKGALNEIERDYPGISFRFLKIIEDRADYYEEHKKIIYVYQKRMEPIDEEHDFFVVDVKPELTLPQIKTRIREIVVERYGNCFELLDNDLGIDSKFNFTIYFDLPEQFLKTAFNVQLHNGDHIEKLAIRFKFSSHDSKLRIMALSMPNLNKENVLQYGRRRILASCIRNIPKRHCRVPLWVRMLLPIERSTLCADCVDTNISATLLNDIYSMVAESGLLKVS
ncbi:hypothetical protein [Methanoregula sp.]|uniref:hypothetical protein n=1 Tax=Methanoregula sp. TaxID=2052170 RepID=UPI003568D46A